MDESAHKEQTTPCSAAISESKETDEIDAIEQEGQRPSGQPNFAHKPPYSLRPGKLNKYVAPRLRRETFDAHKADPGVSLVSINNNGISLCVLLTIG